MKPEVSVLHVEDEPTFANITAEFLTQTDDSLTVETETDPVDALERLRATSDEIDCVISDYKMPAMDGLELLEAIRAEQPDLPFILFTGRGSEGTAAKAISAGVTDYIQKETGSDTYERLAHRIRAAVAARRARGDAARTEQVLKAALGQATDVLAVVTPAHEVVFASSAVETALGYTPAELREQGPFEFVHPDDRDTVENHFERHLTEANASTEITVRARHADGEYHEVEAQVCEVDPAVDIERVLVYTHTATLAETA
jgi:PAS domain S-box-containing protein